MSRNTVLLNSPAFSKCAARIASRSQGRVKHATVEWKTFPDKYPNIYVKDADALAGNNVVFLTSLYKPECLFEQVSVLYSLPRFLVNSLTVILPYFPTGTMERIDDEGQIATAKVMSRILSSMPLTRCGPATLVTYDIHALQNRFYFGDNVMPRIHTCLPLMMDEAERLDDVVVAFPDDGSFKRFHKHTRNKPNIVMTKVRQGDKRIVKLKEGVDPTGKHVILVDDVGHTGGTLLESAQILRDKGAHAVSAFVTHGAFPDRAWQRLQDSPLLDTVWMTESIPEKCSEIAQHGATKFKVIPLDAQILSDMDRLSFHC